MTVKCGVVGVEVGGGARRAHTSNSINFTTTVANAHTTWLQAVVHEACRGVH